MPLRAAIITISEGLRPAGRISLRLVLFLVTFCGSIALLAVVFTVSRRSFSRAVADLHSVSFSLFGHPLAWSLGHFRAPRRLRSLHHPLSAWAWALPCRTRSPPSVGAIVAIVVLGALVGNGSLSIRRFSTGAG
jgi:hypothetical protein